MARSGPSQQQKKCGRSLGDWVVLVYLISHIPITLLMDSQALLPAEWFPKALLNATADYVASLHDPLVGGVGEPVWFNSMVASELVFQLPFFFVATYAFWKQCNWIRIPCLVYATHVATTLIPILAEFWFKDYSAVGLVTTEQKAFLTAIYLPYLLVPLYLMQRMILYEKPFGSATTIHIKSKHT